MLKYRLTTKTLKDKQGNVKGIQNRIIVENPLDLTPQEKAIIDSYVRNGYRMMISQKGEKKATGKGMTAEKILQYFYNEKNEECANELKLKISNSENFMTICKWLKDKKGFTDEIKKDVCSITVSDEVKAEIKDIKAKREEEKAKQE